MATAMLVGSAPVVTHAAQSNEYVDPATCWLRANGRTSEFDANATVTTGIMYCPVCNINTKFTAYRVPEYTKTGETALNRSVLYSDGTCMDGVSKGNVDYGLPGVDAYYTGSHWVKTVCENCGTTNSSDGTGSYAFGKDIYILNPCDHEFFLDFDHTTYTPYNSNYHTVSLKRGSYCQFCKGTKERAVESREHHHMDESVDAQLGNQRFYITSECEDCGYTESEYVAAKSVVESYYGKVDGQPHTVTLNDLSEDGVRTSIRYGTEANKCNKTSAPNYTDEGYYPIYYQIEYSYDDTSMTENGVSYVWLLSADDTNEASALSSTHTHDYRYLETVAPTCTELGYERWQCSECGSLEKRNYKPATGHDYDTIVIREPSCTQGGLTLHMCNKCGSHYTESTPMTEHNYISNTVAATCTSSGYTEQICSICGDRRITDIQPLIRHDYVAAVTAPTCTEKGYTTYTCSMCEDTYIADYVDALGHDWDEGHTVTSSTCDGEGVVEYNCKRCDERMIKASSATGHTPGAAATCTEPQVCTDCGAILELPTGHHYHTTTVVPTCTAMGYTVYECDEHDHSYIADYVDKLPHNYKSVVTAPTCTEMGFTTHTCEDCGDSYISDYTDKIAHSYHSVVTQPTCTEMGYTTYTCDVCGDSYVSDYTDPLPHNYTKQVIEPTCTEFGRTIYTCPDCGTEYIGDYKELLAHEYEATVTEPTCTEMGYTTYVCKDCGDSHISNYTDALGHERSDWIIDTPATIEHEGSKHIECTRCGETLYTSVIPQLPEQDNSDEDGKSAVGEYIVLVTDKDGKPVFNSEISIDTSDNITIKLPDGRLISADDITTVTVIDSETKNGVQDLRIFIADSFNNAATGQTDINGQLRFPNSQSSTGDTNGTVTDDKATFVVIATDKNGELIPNCKVTAGDAFSIDVKLPDGTEFDRDNRITVTVVNEYGEPIKNLRTQIIGDGDHIENGYTNVKGQITLPMSNTDVTDDKGAAEVGEIKNDKIYDYIVSVYDEQGTIQDALVTLISDDSSVLVCLPEGKTIDYYNRTTVKVTKSDGTPVEGWKVTVYNKDGSGLRTEVTDDEGIVIVPPLSEAPISNPTASPEPDTEATPLPGVTESPKPEETAKPEATDAPAPSESPAASDKPAETAAPTETAQPSETGEPTPTTEPVVVPDEPTPAPDLGDGAVVQNKTYKYRVYVWENDGQITEFGLVKLHEDGSLSIELPNNKVLTPENRVNIRVIDENNGAPVKGINVSVTDINGSEASDKTNSNGIAVVPVADGDFTDSDGNATVKDLNGNIYNVNVATEKEGNIESAYVKVASGKILVVLPDGTVIDYSDRTIVTVTDGGNKAVPGMPVNLRDLKGGDKTENTDADGKAVIPSLDEGYTDADGKAVVNGYTVVVENTDGKIKDAFVSLKNEKLSVILPDGKKLVTTNQTTVTVTDADAQPVSGLSITVTDLDNQTATKSTDSNGKITVPVKSSGGSSGGGGGSSRGSSGGGGGSSTPTVRYNIVVTDKDGKTVTPTKSVKDGKITLTLPSGKTLEDGYYTIIVKDTKGNTASGIDVTLKDKKNGEAEGKTDKNGSLVLPSTEHKAYVYGYETGKFLPEGNMTRSEAAAIFARIIAERRGETIPSRKSSFKDVDSELWYSGPIAYLEEYDVVSGYSDGTFAPEEPITRAEFVAMCSRFYEKFNKMTNAKSNGFSDVKSSHWAYSYINEAAAMDWIAGYADGTFRPDNNIKRAEVVAIVNRMTGRSADRDYINNHMSEINPYSDLKDSVYWAFYDVLEASTDHSFVTDADGEIWVR